MVMADLGGPMAHQLPFHNNSHRGELVQPSLVMNHHHNNSSSCHGGERDVHGNFIKKQRLCVGCGGQILDQYILRVSPDLEWHAACLKCQECRQFLDESCTCFVRDGKTYCKRDYVRLFGTKCDKCNSSFSKNDFVMRARSKIYHIECFRCSACTKQLKPGDEFALRDGGVLYCKEDHDVLEQSLQGTQHIKIEQNENNAASSNDCSVKDNPPNHSVSNNSSEFGSMSDSESESDSYKSARGKFSGSVNGKPTRVRTVLNEKQLHMLRTCYNANPRPDALIKEKLVEMTGLSPRVVRVWFQNKRCKDKKKTIQMKLQMQQEKEGKLGYMKGIPLVASSPVRHDSPLNLNGLEVTKYQPPWKALADFALNSDLDNNNFNTHTPGFQHLVNQLHGYDMNEGYNSNHHNQMQGYMNMDNNVAGNHPDSTDSYETYLESEESV